MKSLLPIVLFLFAILKNSSAQEALKINSVETANEQIENYIYLYEDTTNTLDINQILTKKGQNFFIPVSQFKRKISSGNTYWLYFSCENNLKKDYLLGLYISKQNHFVEINAFADSTSYVQHTGFFLKSSKNDEIIPFTNIVQVKNTGRISFYIKIKNINDQLPDFSMKLVDLRITVKRNNSIVNFDGFVLGMMVLMMFYGMFLFFQNKVKLFLYYSLYVLFFGILIFSGWGFAYRIFPDLSREIDPFTIFPGFLAIIFYFQFIRLFLNTSQVFPKWDKVFRLFQIFFFFEFVGLIVFVPLTNLVILSYIIGNFSQVLISLIYCAFIIRLILLKTKLTNIVALGGSFLVLGSIIGAILYVILLDEVVFVFTKIGVLCELLVYAYGISYVYSLIEADKQKFQKQLIAQLSENAELHEKVNRELAEKVKERTIEIERQRDKIEKINTEITDSINYAKYIQSSILPKAERLDSYLGEHFVLYKPKDIVSGDFYWISNIEKKTIIAAVDCTGHGVPGAFMSMLGTALLNEIINKEYITHPGVILRRLRKEVINSLQQRGARGEQKDGMDIALCTLDLENMKLQFAGANNPLYLIRKSNLEKVGVLRDEFTLDDRLYEIKGDPMPIGISDRMDNFTFHEIDIYKGDSFYLFTDGFPDQFGGRDCKKFGYKPFREQLLKNSSKNMPDQKTSLEKVLNEWMGNNNQVDDILTIGFRIN